ncbi:hypothetical protein V8D89_002205 [Ganoderma adspersum]
MYQNVLAISLTCSSFRPVAIRRLLSILRPIHLTGGASVRRFHTFLFADAPARVPPIHALDIETGLAHHPPQPGDAYFLVDILTSCQRLEHITFGRQPFTHRLTEDPGVIDAIASIPSLRSLSIQSIADALALVRNVRAPLRKLGLWCFYADGSEDGSEDGGDGFDWYPTAFQDTLSHLLVIDADKIQELQGSNADGHAPVPSVSSWTQYPAVPSLSVNYFTGRLLLEPLQHLFPALDGTLSVGQIDVEYPEDTLSDMRAANQRAQESGNGSRAWRQLDRIICTPMAFYLLGLRCPVRLAMIDGTDRYYDLEIVQRYVAVSLRENPVPRLTLCLALDDALGGLGGLLPPELGDTLTHLTLVLDAAGHGPPAVAFGWDELLDAMLASLQPLHKLAYLRIVIQSESPAAQDTDTGPGASAPAPPSFAFAEQLSRALHLSTLDFQGAAASLARRLPSLQSPFLTTCGHFTLHQEFGDATSMVATSTRWCISRDWRVAAPTGRQSLSADGGWDEKCTRMLVEMHDEEAEAVIQREELIIPDAYKVWFTQNED